MTEHPHHIPRERRLAEVLVGLADTLGGDFDMDAHLGRLAAACVELLDARAAGLLLAGPDGALRAASSGAVPELLPALDEEGPCLDCYVCAATIDVPDLARCDELWPRFAPRAREAGLHAAYAVPLRRGAEVIGALGVLRADPGEPPAGDVELARALADAAAVGVLQRRARREQELLAEQLQGALDSRVAVEQAKGVLAERWGVGVDEAFGALRRYARSHRLRVAELATGVVAGSFDTDRLRDDAT
ncbi:GAF and ANTAR domain-containing protein [Streptomyces sp. NPDC058691]|uniref:GAF and ANTAR domain-containing protein n=1 Tax=Streptomyces sp. NPDC058691 TaxID=3346601 RepID=UPI00366A3F39